jgi:type IV secretory pathway VirB2 component (pilin)
MNSITGPIDVALAVLWLGIAALSLVVGWRRQRVALLIIGVMMLVVAAWNLYAGRAL